MSALALAAARAGLGVALAPERMAREDLATGRLVALPGEPLPMSHEYLLVYANASAGRPALRALIAHIRSA